MPAESVPTRGKRAQLKKLNNDLDPTGEDFRVQFNPQSLDVSYSTTLSGIREEDQLEKQQTGGQSTSMDVELFFDVTRPTGNGDRSDVKDVRDLTKRVEALMQSEEQNGQGDSRSNSEGVQPNVRFIWGSFQFDGVITRMKENLEFFDPEGRPLRATVSMSLSGQKPPQESENGPGASSLGGNLRAGEPGGRAGPGPEEPPPGAENTNGTPLQQLAGEAGAQGNWKDIAAQNGIENPRSIHNPGAVDLSASPPGSVSSSAGR
jgi:hypothetical protein